MPDDDAFMLEGGNPAMRLHTLFGKAYGENLGAVAIQGWWRVWGVETDEQLPAMALSYAHVMSRMADQSYNAIMGLAERDVGVLLRNYGNVYKCLGNFTQVHHITMGEFLGDLSDAGMMALELCGLRLLDRRPENEPVGAVVKSLIDQVQGLLREIDLAMDLDAQTRMTVRTHLWSVLDALSKANLTGWREVEVAANAAVGEMVKSPGLMTRMASSTVGKAAGVLFFAVATNAGTYYATEAITAGRADSPAPAPITQVFNQYFDVDVPPQLPPADLPRAEP